MNVDVILKYHHNAIMMSYHIARSDAYFSTSQHSANIYLDITVSHKFILYNRD